MESIFTFLFKYRPLLFEEGEVVFATPWPVALLLVGAAAVAIAAVVTYAPESGKASPTDRAILATLRLVALGVLAFVLLQPTLVLTSVVAQRNFVGVLLDDSRSMQLPGTDDGARRDFVTGTFGPEGSDLVTALGERFSLRYFRFSSDASRVGDADGMTWNGTRTDLAGALDRAREELSSVPLSGLVVVSDGADNGGTPLAEALVPLQAASIPVFTVGLGEEAMEPDVQLGRVELPRSVLQGSSLAVDVVVTHRGYRGRTVEVVVEDGNRRVAQESVVLRGDDEPTIVPVRITLEEPGARRLRFHVPRIEDEAVAQNNTRDLLVDVRERREKILYFEGEPRHEVGFIRRAIQEDENLQLVVLQQTAEGKFARFNVDDGDELASGFPRTREELFQYRGLIIGSVQASFFTQDQLAMIGEFASRRGGGVLFLGGRLSFAEGGYARTAIEDALPVLLEDAAPDARAAFSSIAVRPTNAGLSHPIAQILPSAPEAEAAPTPRRDSIPLPATLDDAWNTLPPLSTMNRIVRAKPGATTLLTGRVVDALAPTTQIDEERIVLAHHRYGRGTVIAFPVQDVWTWQMHAAIAIDDQRHELLWQQLLRWLVDGVPDAVEVEPDRERVEPGEALRVRATVLDSAYLEVNSAEVRATVTSPTGETRTENLTWTVDEDGVYELLLAPDILGTWQVDVGASSGELALGAGTTFFEVGPSDDEYFDAGRRTALLERLADETGGRFYTPETVSDLPEDLRFTGAGVTLTEERDLWDAPFFFLLLVGLVGAEWGFRRVRGMV